MIILESLEQEKGKGKREEAERRWTDILTNTSVCQTTLLLNIFTVEPYGYHLALPNTYSLPRHVLFVLPGEKKVTTGPKMNVL